MVQAAAAVLAAFPPRGVIRMLPPEHTMGGKPKIERLVAEEYILDTIHFYNGDRVECARTLASGVYTYFHWICRPGLQPHRTSAVLDSVRRPTLRKCDQPSGAACIVMAQSLHGCPSAYQLACLSFDKQ